MMGYLGLGVSRSIRSRALLSVSACAMAGLAMPNTPALALTRHGEAAGTAAAMLGCVQFGVGAGIAPLVGLLGSSAAAMGAVMLVVTVLAAALMIAVVRRDPTVHAVR